jgi:hypothetical protein
MKIFFLIIVVCLFISKSKDCFSQSQDISISITDNTFNATTIDTFSKHDQENVPLSHEKQLFTGNKNLLHPKDDFLSFEKRAKNENLNWVIYWISLSLLLTGLARFIYPVSFNETMKASVNSRFFSLLEKESGIIGNMLNYILYANFLLIFAVIALLSLRYLDVNISLSNIHILIPLSIFVVLGISFSIVKLWLLNFGAWIFNTSRETLTYIRNIIVVNELTGVLLLPLMFIYLINPFRWLIYTIWLLVILLFLFKIIRGAWLGINHSRFSLYYLILYLCAVEIMPLLIFIKFSKNYFQI